MAEQLTIKINADLSGLGSGLNDAARQVSSFGDTLKGAFLGGLGADLAARAFGAFTSGITDAIHALAEVDRISGQTAAVIKSTGGAAGVAAADVALLADSIERKTGIEAESIQKGQNLLLTFTNIKNAAGANNDIFNQATAIMADLGTAMGTDASGAAIQLGKALNDPTAGITALTRVGVTFTDAQKATIKSLQESGDLMGAQKIILAELSKEFGGSADAAGKTFAGALDRAKNAIGSISEAMVGPAVPIFTAALIKVSNAAYAISDAITDGQLIQLFNQAFGPGTKSLVVGLAAVMTASLAPSIVNVGRQAVAMAATYTRALVAMAAANAPLVAAIATISFAAYPFIKNWDTVKNLFIAAWQSMVNGVNSAWQTITSAAKNAFEILSGNFRAAYYNAVSFFIGPLTRSFNALFNSLPDSIKTALGGLKFTMPKFELGSGAGAAFETFKATAVGALDTVRGAAMIAKENFASTWGGLPGDIRKVMNNVTGVFSASSVESVKSLGAISSSGARMGESAKQAGSKAVAATKEHKQSLESLASGYLVAGRDITNFLVKAGDLKRLLDTQITWKRLEKETAEYVAVQEKANKIVSDAIAKIDGIDKVSKYWGETTDENKRKQDILREAINELNTSGLDPQNKRIDDLRRRYDELATGQANAIQKTIDFSQAGDALQGVLRATSETFTFLGSGDSPIVAMIGKVTSGISLFGQWGNAITGAAAAVKALGGVTGIFGAILAAVTAPITLIAVGIGLIVWAAHDAAQAFGGWSKVWDILTLGWQKFSYGFAKVGEVVIGGIINYLTASWVGYQNLLIGGTNLIIKAVNAVIRAINAISFDVPDWVPLIGGNKWNAGLKEMEEFAYAEFKPVMMDFSSKIAADIAQTEQKLADAPGMQPWRVSNPIEEIGKLFKRDQESPSASEPVNASAIAGDMSQRRATEALQQAVKDGTIAGNQASPQIVINYTGNGKWTRDDAQALGQLIVGELKAGGIR